MQKVLEGRQLALWEAKVYFLCWGSYILEFLLLGPCSCLTVEKSPFGHFKWEMWWLISLLEKKMAWGISDSQQGIGWLQNPFGLIPSLWRDGTREPERERCLPKVTQPMNAEPGVGLSCLICPLTFSSWSWQCGRWPWSKPCWGD